MGDTPEELNLTIKLPDQIPTGEEEPEEEKPYLLPIYVYTAIFGAIFILGPLFVRKGPNKGITRCCIMLSAFSCWIFWVTTYIVQMNPLLGPRLSNETVAWIGYKWGNDPRFCVTSDDKEAEESKTAANLDGATTPVVNGGDPGGGGGTTSGNGVTTTVDDVTTTVDDVTSPTEAEP